MCEDRESIRPIITDELAARFKHMRMQPAVAVPSPNVAEGTTASSEATGNTAVAPPLGLELTAQPPGLPGMPLYVISLDNELGEKRRQNMHLDTDYVWVRGVEPSQVPAHVSLTWDHGRMGTDRNRALHMGICCSRHGVATECGV